MCATLTEAKEHEPTVIWIHDHERLKQETWLLYDDEVMLSIEKTRSLVKFM